MRSCLECGSASLLFACNRGYWNHGSVGSLESLIALKIKCQTAEVCPDFKSGPRWAADIGVHMETLERFLASRS